MKKLILGLVAASAVAAAAPGLASADVSNNGTTNDAYGYCQANHIHNFNGAAINGIGISAPSMTGRAISCRRWQTVPRPSTASTPRACPDRFAPISNNG